MCLVRSVGDFEPARGKLENIRTTQINGHVSSNLGQLFFLLTFCQCGVGFPANNIGPLDIWQRLLDHTCYRTSAIGR